MAASTKTLGSLHELVAQALAEQVQGYTETDDEGNERVVRPSPAVLGAAIAFLKNNNITACLLYTSPSPRDRQKSRMPSSA